MKKLFFTVVFLYLLTSCNYYEYIGSIETEPPLEEAVEAVNSLIDEYALYYFDEEYRLSFYEPEEGVYLGAYILSNKSINYDIEKFEKKTGKEHLIYTYHMELGDELPLNWILECMSKMKTPLIVIEPPTGYNPFDLELLKKTAESIDINIPIFIEFYPSPASYGFSVNGYIDFFKKAREVFNKDEERFAFVFSVSGKNTVEDLLYYPGDEYTDWVGINIFMPITEDENLYGEDIFKSIDKIYYTFQTSKPIMLSQFAISHYTSRNHAYYTTQASEEISRIYNKITGEYPRIKAIIYMDFNNVELLKTGIRDNFSITDSETMLEAYSLAIKNEFFITDFAYLYTSSASKQIMKAPFYAKKIGDKFFMPDNIYNFPLGYHSGDIILDFAANYDKKQILINLKK